MTQEKPKESQDESLSDYSQINGDRHILRSAITNSRLLVMAAAERGLEIDKSILSVIVETGDAFQRNTLPSKQKIAFWHAYEQLSSIMHPITIESVRATYNQPPVRAGIIGSFLGKLNVTYSQKCVFGYKLLSTLTLIALIFLQVYWSIGHSLIRDIKTQTDEIFSLEKQIRQLESEEVTNQKTASTNTEKKENLSEITTSTVRKGLHRTTEGIALGGIDSKLEQLFSWREANFGQLNDWNHIWGSVLFMLKQPWEKSSFQQLPKESQHHVEYLAALYVLNAISQYFLPILYGLLGSTFYVLRQLPLEISNLTFSVNSQIDFSLRITQGPLAGIMASFFFTSGNPNVRSFVSENSLASTSNLEDYAFSHIGPLATAFLAGYSVELVFKAVDKVISMITSKSPASGLPTFTTSSVKSSKPRSDDQKKQN